MAEVSRVSGPGGSEDSSKKDKKVADAQKFRELMKVQKVDEVDEEQKKKRKRPQEAEEDAKAQEAAQGAPPPVGVPPTDAPPFAPHSDKKVGGVLKSGQLGGPAPTAPPPSAPAPSEPEDGFWEGETYMQTFPDTTPSQKSAQPPLKTPAPSAPLSAPEPMQPTRAEQPQPPAPVIGPPPTKKAAQAAQKPEVGPPKPAHKEEKESYFTQAKKTGKKKEEIPSVPEEMEGTAVTPPAAAGETRSTKKAKGEEKIEEMTPQTGQMQTPELPLEAPGPIGAPTPPPSYAYLHPHVLDMFERMVGVMTVMTNAGISETTITLSAPQYNSSIFYGAQIIIQEYSTAPKAFNVQLIASPQAVKLFNANADDLMAAFQGGKYNFRINRLEASLASDRPLFKRKEGISGEGKGKEKGER